MSKPVCDDLLILLLTPNLDVIVPDIGLISAIPMLAFPLDVVKFVFTLPFAPYFAVPFFATDTTFAGSIYSFDIASYVVTKSAIFCSYF